MDDFSFEVITIEYICKCKIRLSSNMIIINSYKTGKDYQIDVDIYPKAINREVNKTYKNHSKNRIFH